MALREFTSDIREIIGGITTSIVWKPWGILTKYLNDKTTCDVAFRHTLELESHTV